MPLQVLGVVRREHPPPSSGRKGDTLGVRLVPSGALAAAVLDVDDDVELTEEDATTHLDLLIMLLRDGPVLPLAFGTVSPDEDAVRTEVLDAAAADLERRLEAVDGLVENRLEIVFDEATAMRAVMQEDPRLRGQAAEARGGDAGLDRRIALGEAVSNRLMEWRQVQNEQVLPTLAAAAEAVAELPSSEPLQQRWAFLVRADGVEALDQAVGNIRSALGTAAAMEYVGPLPVYSFLGEPRVEPTQQRSAWGW
jgi:hypothetical protein